MSTVLNVPFTENKEAKKLGAQWDSTIKRWVVPNELCPTMFYRWLPSDDTEHTLITIGPPYSLVESLTICWKCGSVTRAYAFACRGLQDFDWRKIKPGFYILDYIATLPQEFAAAIKHHRFYFMDYSKTTDSWYAMNHCEHCVAQLGDHFLHREPRNAFTPYDEDECKYIKLIRSNKLTKSLQLDCGFHTDSEGGVIRRFAESLSYESWRRSGEQLGKTQVIDEGE